MANTVVSVFPATWNQQQIQFANIILSIEGKTFPYFNEIDYTESVDIEEGRGASPFPMGTTTGQYKAEGNLSVQLSHREEFLQLISAYSPDGNSVYDAVFNLQVQWQTKASPAQVQPPVLTDELFGCRLKGGGINASSGPGIIVVKYPIYCGLVRSNGRSPLSGAAF